MEIYLVMSEQTSPKNKRTVVLVEAAFVDGVAAEEFAAQEQSDADKQQLHTTYYVDSVWVNGLS